MSFCTVVNCMDGRAQLPVIHYLQSRFDAQYVDSITEAGANRVVAEQSDAHLMESVLKRLDISVEKHQSVGIAVVGHHDCAGNPTTDQQQAEHTTKAVAFIKERYPSLDVVGLWVGDDWTVAELPAAVA